MSTPDEYAEFNSIIEFQRQSMNSRQEHVDNSPYGTQMQSSKPGLTKRGKAALGIGAAVLAGGSLIGYQSYAASTAQHEAKAQELAIKQQQLELEKMRETRLANQAEQKTQNSQNETRQASVNRCVKNQEDQVGKEYGSPSYRDIVDACQAQYTDTTSSGDDMQAAASSQAANTSGEGVNNFALLGGGALAVGLVAAAKKSKRSNPA